MNNISFIKRIDDLGRIVIPKEIRKKLKIETNENMEICINNNEIILQKHSLLSEKEKDIIKLCSIINNISKKNILITDREKVLYSSNSLITNKELSYYLKDIITNRKNLEEKIIEITDNFKIDTNYIYKNIIIDSSPVGLIIMYSNEIQDKDKILLEIISKFINNV